MNPEDEKKLNELLKEALDGGEERVVVLSKDEYLELKKMIEDRKALGRAWSIVKTILFGVAATIVAYNTVIEGGMKAISHFLGLGDNK